MYSLIAVLVLGILFGGGSADDDHIPQYLFPEIQNGNQQIKRIQFDAGDDRSVTLLWRADPVARDTTTERQADAIRGYQGSGVWRVMERWGYPADSTRVQEFLQQLATAEKLARKTGNADNFMATGGDDADLRVSIDSLSPFVLGNRPGMREGRYVQIMDDTGSDEVWLVSSDFSAVSVSPTDWLADVIIDIESERLARLTIKHNGSELRANMGDVVQVDGIEVSQLQDPGVADNLRQVLTEVRLIDVLPVAEVGFAQASTLSATLDDASVVEIKLVSQGGYYWMSLPGRQWAYQVSASIYNRMTQTVPDLIQQEATNNEL